MGDLVLGWKVTNAGDPRCWIGAGVTAGNQDPNEWFTVRAPSIAAHTAIIAQSGSGKSFFLGRLVEEILVRTRARCVVLDPNADFRRVYEVNRSVWDAPAYDPSVRRGRLPHEPNMEAFAELWDEIASRTRILVGSELESDPTLHRERLLVNWSKIQFEFLAEDLPSQYHGELYHCHAFVRAVWSLILFTFDPGSKRLFQEAETLFKNTLGLTRAESEETLRSHFDATCKKREELAREIGVKADADAIEQLIIKPAISVAAAAREYVFSEVQRYYFAKAREYEAKGVIQEPGNQQAAEAGRRLEVVDLPSFPDKAVRLLAVNSVLASEWHRVRDEWNQALNQSDREDERVPTFIVVDEAHNLIPSEPRSKSEAALCEQFRTIIAEGRKYGLFLILVTQRPDKIDPQVVSECENRALLRLSSSSVVALSRRLLGLDDVPEKLLERCVDFQTGRVLFVGNWAPDGPANFYCAARRTVEGGRNLRDQFWANP